MSSMSLADGDSVGPLPPAIGGGAPAYMPYSGTYNPLEYQPMPFYTAREHTVYGYNRDDSVLSGSSNGSAQDKNNSSESDSGGGGGGMPMRCPVQGHQGGGMPMGAEMQDVFVNTEDSLTIEEDTWKKEELDDTEEYPMDKNFTESVNNESDSEISVKSNTHITDTDSVSSEFTCKQVPATNRSDSNTPASKPLTCSTCSKSFTSKGDLKRHTRTHTGVKPYKCARCKKCFKQQVSLRNHMRPHTGEKPYKCDRCEKCFTQQATLRNHMRTHTGEKPYKCDRCVKCFTQLAILKNMRTQTGEKPYKCERCEKCCSYKRNSVSHRRTHTGEKPYKCTRCDKCFTQRSHLVSHLRTHSGEKL